MTETSYTAAVSLEHLYHGEDGDWDDARAYLDLIDLSKAELEALEAGMIGQSREARAVQNRMWSAQHHAQAEIVKAALKAGVDGEQIKAITFRETYR